ncbi:hypothetical protein DPMN_040139 [Dreissena polymorpha]|uniref:Uncharacterized protein n=1 Tax=Dreissena polymorpha TaxID=45954 RepID=A0A9D4HWK8_DREPO|nr:hypothetical protein DPMN_040139 [Dreissena polymorpha]
MCFQTKKPIQLSLPGKSEAGSDPRHCSPYSRHSLVRNGLKAFSYSHIQQPVQSRVYLGHCRLLQEKIGDIPYPHFRGYTTESGQCQVECRVSTFKVDTRHSSDILSTLSRRATNQSTVNI